MDLVRTNDLDTGSIENSTFQGGSIELYGGPWTIAGNTVLGSMAQTYSPAAFALHSPHDVTIEGNQVTQSDPAGREFRLVEPGGLGLRQRHRGQHVRRRCGPDRQRGHLFCRPPASFMASTIPR